MRYRSIPQLGKQASVIGFGCASLGSRVSARDGLKALERAFDAGVTWFDTAPPYGDGLSESILGPFLEDKRKQAIVCTKVGIARPSPSYSARVVKPILRRAIAAVPALRSKISNARRPSERVAILPSMILSGAVESLMRLKVDVLDVFALHEPTPEEAADPAIIGELNRVVEKGYARVIGIAGRSDSVLAGLAASTSYGFAQVEDSPFVEEFERIRANAATQGLILATFGVYGHSGALSRLQNLLQSSGEMQSRLNRIAGRERVSPTEVLLDYALAHNDSGPVLLSMFAKGHVEANTARASVPVDLMLVDAVRRMLSENGAHIG